MYYAGIDIGSSGVKAVLLDDKDVVTMYRQEALAPGSEMAEEALDVMLRGRVSRREDLLITVTGISTDRIRFDCTKKSILTSLVRGTRYHYSKARTILDIGAETTTAINMSAAGKVLEYVRNNKCAAGTSMLLTVISDILQIPISDMDNEKYHSERSIKLSNVCSVFAESEAVSYLSRGVSPEEILSGAHEAVVDQLVALLSRIDTLEDIVLTGGAARNRVIVKSFSERIGLPAYVPQEPEMVAALGASLFSRDASKEKL